MWCTCVALEDELVGECEREANGIIAVGAEAQVMEFVTADDGIANARTGERVRVGAILPPVDQPDALTVNVGDFRGLQRESIDDILRQSARSHVLLDVDAIVGIVHQQIAQCVAVGLVLRPVVLIDRAVINQLDRQAIQDGIRAVAQAETLITTRDLDVLGGWVARRRRPQVEAPGGCVIPPLPWGIQQNGFVLYKVLRAPPQTGIACTAIVLADAVDSDQAAADIVCRDETPVVIVPLDGIDRDEGCAGQVAEGGQIARFDTWRGAVTGAVSELGGRALWQITVVDRCWWPGRRWREPNRHRPPTRIRASSTRWRRSSRVREPGAILCPAPPLAPQRKR